ncbi:hypothetical protein K439DRAFT_554630 [Ramaria rubella]|nr:hypothetical protein K439DRAFT_554630 [Ramaria rubella]
MSLRVCELGSESHLKLSWEYTHDRPSVTRSVHFINAGETLLVLFIGIHEVIKFTASTGEKFNKHYLLSRIGTSAICPDGKSLLVGNRSTGVELYDTENLACITKYDQPNFLNVFKQVAYLNGG